MFDTNYSKKELFWWEKPNKLLKNITEYKKSGKVLDLWTGEWKDCIYLSKSWFDVTWVDISEPWIEKLNSIITQNKLNIRTIIEDLRLFKFFQSFDIILCFTVLQLFNLLEIEEVIKKIQDNTNIDWINAITSFTKNNPNKQCPYPNKDWIHQPYYLFDNNELKKYYENWEILYYDEYETPYHNHWENQDQHKHDMVSLIAKKTILKI